MRLICAAITAIVVSYLVAWTRGYTAGIEAIDAYRTKLRRQEFHDVPEYHETGI